MYQAYSVCSSLGLSSMTQGNQSCRYTLENASHWGCTWASCMHFSHWGENEASKLLSVSKVTTVVEVWSEGAVVHSGLVPWVWHRLSCHISITFSSSFLVSFFALCFWLLHSSHHACSSMSVRFIWYVARFTVSIQTSGSIHYIRCAGFTVSLQIDTTQILAQLSQWLLPQPFIQTCTRILQCSKPWCSAIIGPAVTRSAVLPPLSCLLLFACMTLTWKVGVTNHWTANHCTGLDWTGLDWTGLES